MDSGVLQIDSLRAGLSTTRVGRRIVYLVSTTSTNDEAWGRIDTVCADGLAVFAEYQTAGRGRFGRQWQAPRGAGLLCSVALIDERGELSGGALGLLSAVAACDAITASTDVAATIRWPNDLMVSGRKLGGILIESRGRDDGVRAYVVGIGINCLQQRGHLGTALADSATSIELESADPVDRTALGAALLTELDRRLTDPRSSDPVHLRSEWLARAEPMGQRVCLKQAGKVFSGSMIDLDPGAALLVRLDEGGLRAFDAANTTIAERESATSVGQTF